jgi:hypothetical protein
MRTLSRDEQFACAADLRRDPAPSTGRMRAGSEDGDSDEADLRAVQPLLQLRRQRSGSLVLHGSQLTIDFWTELILELGLRVMTVNGNLTRWKLHDGNEVLATQIHNFAEVHGVEVVRMDKWDEPPGGMAAMGSAATAAVSKVDAAASIAEAEAAAASAQMEASPVPSSPACRWAPFVAAFVLGVASSLVPWHKELVMHPSFAYHYPC